MPVPELARLSDQFLTTYGVLFSSGSPYVGVNYNPTGNPTSGVNEIVGVTSAGLVDDHWAPVYFHFFNPYEPTQIATTDYVSIRGDSYGNGGQISLEAYDIYGNLIDSMIATDSGGTLLEVSGPGIHYALYSAVVNPRGVSLDDLQFEEVALAPVPEPATVLLLGTGLVGLAGAGRKKFFKK